MPLSAVDSLALSRRLIRVLIRVNQVLGLGITAMLIASLAAEDFVFRALGVNSVIGAPVKVVSMRLIMVFGILSAPLAHLILTRLLALVESVSLGPFISANADRLRQMGWALLGLEVLHIAVGSAAAVGSWGGERIPINWAFSATRWLAVLMLFVLARVFEQGTAMREDLEGTV